MNFEVIFSPGAEADLAEIEDYLASRFSERNASQYIQRIITHCRSLGLAPYRGTRQDKVRPGLRTIGFERRITILFEVQSDAIVVLGVLYGGRSLESSF